MSARRRSVAATLLGLGCLGLAACGDNGTAADNAPAAVQPTSYVMVEPETTTTTIAGSAATVPPEGAIDPNEQTYVIVGGDSVFGIAEKHGITMDQLVQYNQWPDGINHVLDVGAEIKIPPNAKVPGTGSSGSGTGSTDSGSGSTGSGSVPTETEPPATPCTHTVVADDNPTRVAEQYGISVQVLEQANAGNPAYLSFIPGSSLNIPAGADGC